MFNVGLQFVISFNKIKTIVLIIVVSTYRSLLDHHINGCSNILMLVRKSSVAEKNSIVKVQYVEIFTKNVIKLVLVYVHALCFLHDVSMYFPALSYFILKIVALK